ncbi:hypothetical protein K439DRAFT_1515266 [Ramaria rubella]|nr:hypothetical protein K439DRAFT_1515266 [Ramaria rubella]
MHLEKNSAYQREVEENGLIMMTHKSFSHRLKRPGSPGCWSTNSSLPYLTSPWFSLTICFYVTINSPPRNGSSLTLLLGSPNKLKIQSLVYQKLVYARWHVDRFLINNRPVRHNSWDKHRIPDTPPVSPLRLPSLLFQHPFQLQFISQRESILCENLTVQDVSYWSQAEIFTANSHPGHRIATPDSPTPGPSQHAAKRDRSPSIMVILSDDEHAPMKKCRAVYAMTTDEVSIAGPSNSYKAKPKGKGKEPSEAKQSNGSNTFLEPNNIKGREMRLPIPTPPLASIRYARGDIRRAVKYGVCSTQLLNACVSEIPKEDKPIPAVGKSILASVTACPLDVATETLIQIVLRARSVADGLVVAAKLEAGAMRVGKAPEVWRDPWRSWASAKCGGRDGVVRRVKRGGRCPVARQAMLGCGKVTCAMGGGGGGAASVSRCEGATRSTRKEAIADEGGVRGHGLWQQACWAVSGGEGPGELWGPAGLWQGGVHVQLQLQRLRVALRRGLWVAMSLERQLWIWVRPVVALCLRVRGILTLGWGLGTRLCAAGVGQGGMVRREGHAHHHFAVGLGSHEY